MITALIPGRPPWGDNSITLSVGDISLAEAFGEGHFWMTLALGQVDMEVGFPSV